MTGIYKITSPTGKVYIGQSVNIVKRFKVYKRFDCKNQTKIYHSLKKYGIDSHKFEVICLCEIFELNDKERYYQIYYNSIQTGLNCVISNDINCKRIISEETKNKISIANKKRKRTDKELDRLRSSFLGKKHSKESIDKMKLNNARANLGKKTSDEVKLKISLNSKSSKIVLNVETGIYYNSIKESSIYSNRNYQYIRKNIKKNKIELKLV